MIEVVQEQIAEWDYSSFLVVVRAINELWSTLKSHLNSHLRAHHTMYDTARRSALHCVHSKQSSPGLEFELQ